MCDDPLNLTILQWCCRFLADTIRHERIPFNGLRRPIQPLVKRMCSLRDRCCQENGPQSMPFSSAWFFVLVRCTAESLSASILVISVKRLSLNAFTYARRRCASSSDTLKSSTWTADRSTCVCTVRPLFVKNLFTDSGSALVKLSSCFSYPATLKDL